MNSRLQSNFVAVFHDLIGFPGIAGNHQHQHVAVTIDEGEVAGRGQGGPGLGVLELGRQDDVAGQAGVEKTLANFREEIERGMKLMGARSVADLGRNNLRFR